ncbi:GvpL/GvpF family gas vesicle protein [Microcoleus sp. FACHB-1515]|uniref:GvpL/GvpF family gas vesicle protein n=1 Tax=Cyanophyceae TaxID=3028117 RepID=UPI00168A30D5|nr:GvpL/GvpF family gas vesicle protein [Microcoleus sp. FACHB-1515]MBD2090881.1 GvpL/GvpF family gas vesicle protein [Microcoleus sp. FACHB-1515]
MIYAYTFLASSTRSILTLPAGFAGNLAIVSAAELVAVVEPELDLEMLQRSDEQLMQAVLNHDRVIRELFEQTTLLPLRFGTCFVSEAGLVEHLHTHQQAYLNKLAALTNQVEYSLKCSPLAASDRAIEPDLKGKDYSLAKSAGFLQETQRQQMQQSQLRSLQATIAQSYPVTIGEVQDGVERLYLLVDQSIDAQLQQQFQQWQADAFLWQLSLGNGLPPYHFV